MPPVTEVREIRSEAFFRLKYRSARFQRLVELGAPDLLLLREALLIAEAAERLSPDMCHAIAADVAAGRHKRLLNLCESEGCEEHVAWIPNAGRPRLPRVFQDTRCFKHVREAEAEVEDEDLDEDAP